MADSIHEKIVKNIKTTLEGIKVSNGYANTVRSVQRLNHEGQTTGEPPYIVVLAEPEETRDLPSSLTRVELPISIAVVIRIDDKVEKRSADEVVNSWAADVEKAMKVDPLRGGNAIDTRKIGGRQIDLEEGDPRVIVAIGFRVTFFHAYGDPTLAA